tara:strand:+ start:46843 stop:47688 length:846 start_codon:yes stop_codon:yes gene_type:complete
MKKILKIIDILLETIGININLRKPNSRRLEKVLNLKPKPFKKTKFVYNNRKSIYQLSPMPSEKDLFNFYRNKYWVDFRKKRNLINTRDLFHFNLLNFYLKKYPPKSDLKKASFLNFGSGHGGISHIVYTHGMRVINIEPDPMTVKYSKFYEQFLSLEEYLKNSGDKIDIFYSSHVLEHLRDIEEFLKQLRLISHDNTLFFIEVPDALSPGNGVQNNSLDIPHTLYFTKKFFESEFNEILHISHQLFNNKMNIDINSYHDLNKPYEPKQRGVIRCISRKLKK